MTRSTLFRGVWTLPGVALTGLACIGMAAERAPVLALINETPSVARGLYVRDVGAPVRRGDLAGLPQPAAARAYLAGLGLPADVLLLKRVAAVGGDTVCTLGDVVLVDGGRVQLLDRDRRGVALTPWRECRVLAPEELFLLGDTPTSFDSRYFGPVRLSDLDGVFQETLTW